MLSFYFVNSLFLSSFHRCAACFLAIVFRVTQACLQKSNMREEKGLILKTSEEFNLSILEA